MQSVFPLDWLIFPITLTAVALNSLSHLSNMCSVWLWFFCFVSWKSGFSSCLFPQDTQLRIKLCLSSSVTFRSSQNTSDFLFVILIMGFVVRQIICYFHIKGQCTSSLAMTVHHLCNSSTVTLTLQTFFKYSFLEKVNDFYVFPMSRFKSAIFTWLAEFLVYL